MTLSDLPKLWTTLQNISKFRVSMCLKLIFKVLYFLKMFPIFVGSVHDFGWTMTLFSEKILISNRCISGLMSNLIKKSWTVSNACYVIYEWYLIWMMPKWALLTWLMASDSNSDSAWIKQSQSFIVSSYLSPTHEPCN